MILYYGTDDSISQRLSRQRKPKQYRGQIFQIKSDFLSERGRSPCDLISLKGESDSTTFVSPEKYLNFHFNLV